MIWLSTAAGELVYVSKEWEVFTGRPSFEAYGMGWLNRIHSDDRVSAIKSFRSARSSKQLYESVYRLSQSDGMYRWIKSQAFPSIAPGSQRLLGYCGEAYLAPDVPPIANTENFSAGATLSGPINAPSKNLMVENLADHLISAHRLAVNEKAKSIASTIELALYQVGSLLAAVQRESDPS